MRVCWVRDAVPFASWSSPKQNCFFEGGNWERIFPASSAWWRAKECYRWNPYIQHQLRSGCNASEALKNQWLHFGFGSESFDNFQPAVGLLIPLEWPAAVGFPSETTSTCSKKSPAPQVGIDAPLNGRITRAVNCFTWSHQQHGRRTWLRSFRASWKKLVDQTWSSRKRLHWPSGRIAKG